MREGRVEESLTSNRDVDCDEFCGCFLGVYILLILLIKKSCELVSENSVYCICVFPPLLNVEGFRDMSIW